MSYAGQNGTGLFRPLFFCGPSSGTRSGTHFPQHQKLPLENEQKHYSKLWVWVFFFSRRKTQRIFNRKILTQGNSCIWLHTDPQTAPRAHPSLSFFKLKKKISGLTALRVFFAGCEGVSSCSCGTFRNEEPGNTGTALHHPRPCSHSPGPLGPRSWLSLISAHLRVCSTLKCFQTPIPQRLPSTVDLKGWIISFTSVTTNQNSGKLNGSEGQD